MTDVHTRGIGIPAAVFFIVGEIAGAGVLTLPKAVENTGKIGFLLIVFCAFLSSYTGAILGRSWLIIIERYPEYRQNCPDPYPVLGEKTFGKLGRYIVSFSINFTLFGAATVYILLASENIQELLEDLFHFDWSFCYWLLLLAGILCPFTFFGTPADFWPVALGATASTAIGSIILLVNMGIDAGKHGPVRHSKTSFTPFFTAFGTIVFAFSGHPAFPTFQADMRKPHNFKWAVFLGYFVVSLMYVPVATSGYVIYGEKLVDNVLKAVSSGGLVYSIEILITLHLVLAFLIVLNPFCQEIEKYAKVPKHFTWKRCVFRTIVVALVLFVAETIPHFGSILSLVGGSTVTLLSYVFPALFYLKLSSEPKQDTIAIINHDLNQEDSVNEQSEVTKDEKTKLPLWMKVMNIEIIVIGLVAGIASTYSAIADIASPGSFTVPCYVNITAASK